MQSAFEAVAKYDTACIDDVMYNVEVSKNLLKQFQQQTQKSNHQIESRRMNDFITPEYQPSYTMGNVI